MAIVNPNLQGQTWQSLGQKKPDLMVWSAFNSFSEYQGSLRLTAFSFEGDYKGKCYLRIRYDGRSIIYSKWYKIYPDPLPKLFNLYIDSNFADIPKTLEIADIRPIILKIKPKPVNWTLKIDLLT